jgi:hypothetical protein
MFISNPFCISKLKIGVFFIFCSNKLKEKFKEKRDSKDLLSLNIIHIVFLKIIFYFAQ